MNIFVDESGSFPLTASENSWCVIAAYLSPESDRKSLQNILRKLRAQHGPTNAEVKLGKLSECEYFTFLKDLSSLRGVAVAAATEMSLNTRDILSTHQRLQAEKVVANVGRMKIESARQELTDLKIAVERLPPNLYAQMCFQISLFHEVLNRGTLYYAQRWPQVLREFRWRIDQKNATPQAYERTFSALLPVLLQTMSIREPMPRLVTANYSHMSQYEYAEGEAPDYLSKEYGLPEMESVNLGKLVRGNFKFVDSKISDGVQAVDLVASGLRRVLKGEFVDNDTAARLLGRLLIQAGKEKPPIKLVAFGASTIVSAEHRRTLDALTRNARAMIA
ncbi:MAG: DUF3800 domain-containing protein [Polaromonas sp.]|nr:DUF3800 domain-containing protein [Polaromonas sp.]